MRTKRICPPRSTLKSSRPHRAPRTPARPPFSNRVAYLQTLSEEGFIDEIIKEANEQGWIAIHHPDSRRATGKGLLDIFLAHPERLDCFWIEAKKQRGRVSAEQKTMLVILHARGYEAWVARPTDWEKIVARLAA